ncbi:uncharacterized protein LOC133036262 [Cannabis sativa]|uniref:uncharacterized protein LOC133036262 n=1 Tax=Cannabis sativa TaxID=3483 RepID=UPI0029CA9A06|nr:uncharacterized protein LOC133036262 [Cannabis sativa]
MEVSIRFASSLFVLIMLYVRYSSGQSYPAASNIKLLGYVRSTCTTIGVAGPEESPMHFQKEIIFNNGVPSAPDDHEFGNKMNGGRKMMIQSKKHMELVFLDEEDRQGILKPKISTSHRRLKAKRADVIAFNSDYHVPRPHPPKNN